MSIGSFGRKTHFIFFSNSTFGSDVSWWHKDKVVCGCATTNLPLFSSLKTVCMLQRLYNEVAFINFVIRKILFVFLIALSASVYLSICLSVLSVRLYI